MAAKREKVVVAMSGGVDSSVAACLLVEQGYDVMGLFMRTGVQEPQTSACTETPDRRTPPPGETTSGPKPARLPTRSRSHQGCCSASDAADARFVAGMLGIPLYVLNFEKDFDRLIDYFTDEYARGRTPNPCIVCNDRLKFGRLVDYADSVGARYVATGHYARIGVDGEVEAGIGTGRAFAEGSNGRKRLLRGIDGNKDQSYVLFGLNRTILDRILFPIGHLRKSEVRAIAGRLELPNHDKPDSVEICFVPDNDYARLVRKHRPEAFTEGDVVNEKGQVIGRHKGIGHYTVGQRRGLGIAAGHPLYVTALDREHNRVTAGYVDTLLSSELVASRANFLVPPPAERFRASVKIRYLHKGASATVELLPCQDSTAVRQSQSEDREEGQLGENESDDGRTGSTPRRVRVLFDTPQRAITPGQAVVFYDGDVVLGGAWIRHAVRPAIATAL